VYERFIHYVLFACKINFLCFWDIRTKMVLNAARLVKGKWLCCHSNHNNRL